MLQKLEYFTKILRLIMSLHRDIMELQLQAQQIEPPPLPPFREYINSLASDDHTGMDSFHECLQEYGEGLEVVQICLEPEDTSIKDEELSALCDLSFDDCIKKDDTINENLKNTTEKVNGVADMKISKSDDSLDDPDDDMTIREDDVLITPRELPDNRTKFVNTKHEERCLSKQPSKDISTSDEMVFAVTPTGLERISFEKYWKECDAKTTLEKVKSDESWKECLNSPTDEIASFYDATTRISVQEEGQSLLYIDHEVDGYETCVDDDSTSVKCTEKNGSKINGDREIKVEDKHNKIDVKNKDNDSSAKKFEQNTDNVTDEVSYNPCVQEHIIKQMKSLRIEPININLSHKKKKKSPTKPKPSKSDRVQCVEYYNDQAECLEEIRLKKVKEEERKYKAEQKQILDSNRAVLEKKLHLKIQEPSEESTDLETNYVPGCHKCFLENYAYAITKAYIAEAHACKFCEVIRDMLEAPKVIPDRRMSAPAFVSLDSPSTTDEEELLLVPVVKHRRKSAGPLKFLVPSRRPR
ncbi:hypothetical protein MSG28_012824 [Choristoneura fumiferana]|uniref:Uncharacterized protein n=1 Tax=Choristoneura fumiferana TaxID=7141 RepID=A0ACC0JI64_CHOFU|nr:hypothetical protein MSG28_012824 [Choristoneura fumiferana]